MNYSLKKSRIRLLLGVAILIAVVLIARLYMIQIVYGDTLSQKAERQYIKPNTNLFDRGSISFKTKKGEKIGAATLQSGYTLVLNPSVIKESADIYNNLSFVLDISEEDFLDRVKKSNDPYEELARRLSKEDKDRIEAMNLEGVSLYKERWRFYPGKNLAAEVLGFVSWKGDELLGQYGLERQYEDLLNRNTETVYANFFVEILSDINQVIEGKENQGSIVTTIEPFVQDTVEKELAKLREKWKSDLVGAIIMNPKTGEIRTMAVNPTFDLNKFNEVDDFSLYGNPLVEGVYEMGSIVKPLTMAIGLDTGVITPESTYDDKGKITSNGYTIYNYDKKARGVVSMQEILNQSLNTGAAYIAEKVGNNTFADYVKNFFGDKTGIDLPNEQSSLLSNLDSKRKIEIMTASFGQGIALSPISITRALASLGNGGKLVTPYVVESVDYKIGITKNITPQKEKQIFSKKTSEEISRMLVKVVDEALLGGEVALPHYSIAAKTGTAQIANREIGGYYDDRYLHSFFGYFPAFDPEFIVFLYNVNPKGVDYASQTLTEPFMNITKFLINYYEIPPDR
jgi:cell division protein FtsI/penicillin-binding protein 2